MSKAKIFNFQPSEGTTNEGHRYERKLTALFALRLYNDQKEFSLLFNTKGFDKWDDVVIITYEGGEKQLYCFQLKHVTGSSNAKLRPDMFEVRQNKTKCICNLKKLFAGYQKIKESLPTMDNEIFRNINIDNVNLILFTNMIGKLYVGNTEILNCNELFQTKNQEEDIENVTVDLQEYKKKLENGAECEKFFKRWFFSGSQASAKELDTLIKEEINKILNLENDVLLTTILKQYLEYIDLWTEGKLNEFHTLTPKHIRINLAEILISTLEIVIPSEYMFESSAELSYLEWNEITANKSLIVLESTDSQILSFVYTAIIKTQKTFETSLLKKILRDEVVDIKSIIETLNQRPELDLCCYLSNDIESNLYIPKNTKLLLWKLGLIPLVIKVRNTEDMKIIQKTLAIAKEENIMIIIITTDTLPSDLKQLSIKYLSDFNQQDIHLFDTKCITLNGQNFTLRHLLNTCPKLNTYLSTDNIIHILTNSCDVGNTFHHKTEEEKLGHIRRQIPAVGLNAEILKCRTDIIIIYGANATIRSLEFIPDVDVSGCWEFKVNDKLTEDTFVRHRIILIANPNDDDCFELFKKCWKFTNKNIHLIKLHLYGDTVILQWIRTSKSVDTIRQFRISLDKFPKVDISSIKGPVNILSADPGYGKTEMMYQLASELKDHAVVFVTLTDHAKYFLETKIKNPIAHLQYFFHTKTVNNDLPLNMFNAYLSSKQILVVLDGMDEISTTCKDKVIKFIQKMIKLEIKIWITCRVCVQEELENEMGSLAFTLNPFNEQEQSDFLTKYNFTHAAKENILNSKQGLLEIPLYLYMLCESSSDFSNMLRLCDDFIQKEVEKYCKKIESPEMLDYLTEELNIFIQQFALYNSFPETLVNYIIKENTLTRHIKLFIQSRYTSFGLIRKYNVNDQDQYGFVHKEICDYIAAKALVEITDARKNIALMEYLFDEKSTSLRSLFYKLILAEEDISSLRQAVLEYNYEKVSLCLLEYSENVQEDLTTSLHLAAQWGRRHYYPTDTSMTFAQQRCYRAKETGAEKIMKLLLTNQNVRELINEKDNFLSWTPVQYADHSGSLEMLELFSTVDTFEISWSELLKEIPQSVLLYFCIKYRYNNLFRLLTESTNLNLASYRDESDNTLLHIASANGNCDVLDILVNNISHAVVNKQKETPLHVAAYGHQNVVSFLISRQLPLEVYDNKRYTPLHRAVNCGQEEIVRLLIQNDANISTHALNEYSLLHTAAYCNNIAIVSMLIESGASANECDDGGNLPLHTAVEWNSVDCINILIENTTDINTANKRGNTPLRLAVLNGQLQIVKMLISKDANANTVNLSMQQMLPPIFNYLKPLIHKEFTGRSGKLEDGQDFELKMVALLSLRCCGADTEEMSIAMHMDECGDFSDIIIHRQQKDRNNETFLIQLKLTKPSTNITPEEFNVNGNYSILKYETEVEQLRKFKSSSKNSRLSNFLNNSTVNLILFTNRKLFESVSYDFLQKISHQELSPIIVNTNSNIYKINLAHNFDQNQENLYLFTEQVSTSNIDAFLEHAFIELIGPLELPIKTVRQYINDYLAYLSRWAQGRLGGHGFLSKDHIISFLSDLLLSPYVKISEHDKVYWTSKSSSEISEDISGNPALRIINSNGNSHFNLYQEIIERLDKYWICIPKTKSWTKYFSDEEKELFYRNNQTNKHHLFRIVGKFGKLSLIHLYKCMWIKGEIPLVVEITSKVDRENILNIHKLSQGTLKLVLLNRTSSVMTP